jgi:non-specific serine/threonine protein kinase
MWASCGPLWLEGSHQDEGLARLEQLANGRQLVPNLVIRSRVARLVGSLQDAAGHPEHAARELRTAVSCADSAGDELASADARFALAEVLLASNDPSAAREWFETALAPHPPAASWLVGAIHARLAEAHAELGNISAAWRHAETAMIEAQQSGAAWTLAQAWYATGLLAARDGDSRASVTALEQATSFAARSSAALSIKTGIELALLLLDQRRHATAARLIATVLERARQHPNWRLQARTLDAAAELIAPTQTSTAARLAGAAANRRISKNGSASWRDLQRLDRWTARARARARQGWTAAYADGQGWDATTALDVADREVRALVRRFEDRESLLNAREREVAQLLADGLSNRAIARTLSLSVGTVRVYVDHVLHKLQLRSRAQVKDWLATETADLAVKAVQLRREWPGPDENSAFT